MRTPVLVLAGQELTEAVRAVLVSTPGTVVVTHRFNGHVVIRGVTIQRGERTDVSEWPLEVSNCCVGCTARDDLLILLRRLHRRNDVSRIVIHLDAWLEPEPVCWAINNVDVHVGPGYIDGPAARDVYIEAVVSTINTEHWLVQALGDDILDDDRTQAQVVVAQAEFADLLVLTDTDAKTLAVLNRLAPRARFTIGVDEVETALTELAPDARRGGDYSPHEHLLAGRPPLDPNGDVALVEFNASRPFHPMRLHLAIDDLLDGVVRVRGRAWLASQPDAVIWIESAGGGLRVAHAGQWLATMDPDAWADDPERVALARLRWNEQFGDRHIAMTVLVCGADPDVVTRALRGALLTDDEMSKTLEWPDYDDPFQEWHEDPCDDLDKVDESNSDGGDFGFS